MRGPTALWIESYWFESRHFISAMHQPRCTASKELRGCFHVDGEGVCVCVTAWDQGSRSCVFVFGQREKNTQCDWDKQRMVKKRTCVLWFQELYTEAVSIAKIWMCTIMWNPFSLTVNVCGCISISNYKIVCKMRIRVPQIIVHWSYSPSKATG